MNKSSTPWEKLERLKVEADRWIAAVGQSGDAAMMAEASRGIRELIDQAHHLPSERGLSLPKALREASAFLAERGKPTLAGDCAMCADVIEEILTEDAHG